MKKYLYLSLILLLISTSTFAQFDVVMAAEIEETNEDANTFLYNFTRPGFEGLMSASNSGWFTSAKPLKTFHVEVNISAAAAFVPTERETFKFKDADYYNLRLKSGSDILPTLLGGEAQSQLQIVYEDAANNETELIDFDAPDGIKNDTGLPENIVPAPNVQVSIGLPIGFEAGIRYLPKIVSENGGYVQILGLGVKHSLSQYFGNKKDSDGNEKKRHLNVAVQASYQYIEAGLDDKYSDKAIIMNLKAISGNVLASYDYKFFSIYSAIGYTKAFSGLDVLGTYEYTYTVVDNTTGTVIGTHSYSLKDPVNLDFDISGMKASLGIKLKLYFLNIYADYTLQEYPVANVGIGFKI